MLHGNYSRIEPNSSKRFAIQPLSLSYVIKHELCVLSHFGLVFIMFYLSCYKLFNWIQIFKRILHFVVVLHRDLDNA